MLSLTITVYASNFGAYDMVVAQDGSGDFVSIGEAIESLPMYSYQRVSIFIENGVYNEKFKIDRDYISLIGESRDSTIIAFEILRQDWIENKDDIGPAVVNIYANDVVLINLTIENTQPLTTEHAFAIYGKGTRTIITNCSVLSNGGDTVSLWNYKTGMYYHDNCYFKGAVDFVCPRGWCYISNSEFYEVRNTAALWHAAPTDPNQKFVLQNCVFNGADSFYLARHHYDAQFYFLNCTFPELMQDKSIEHVVYNDSPKKNRPYLHGDRYYFYNCSRTGGNYKWFANNLDDWPEKLAVDSISAAWTFDYQWNPMDTTPLVVDSMAYDGESLFMWFNELVMSQGELEIRSNSGVLFSYFLGNGRNRLELRSNSKLPKNDLGKVFTIANGNVKSIRASVSAKSLSSIFINSKTD